MEQTMINFVESSNVGRQEKMMSSLEIAEATGKQHAHVMEAIRKMESSWVKLGQSNFRLATYKDAQGKERPCYYLNKTETLYISTKFKDEARAKLVLRWKALETGQEKPIGQQKQLSAVEMFALQAQINLEAERRVQALETRLDNLEAEREENTQKLLQLPITNNPLPIPTMRKSIVAHVNEYAAATNIPQREVWHKIYANLYNLYGKSINAYKKISERESKLDVAERNNLLEPILDIISDMIAKYRLEKKKQDA